MFRLPKKIKIPSLDVTVWIAIGIASIFAVALFFWLFRPLRISVDNKNEHLKGTVGPLTGEPCADVTRRPVAVMLASDPEARPLSGITAADVVMEMPVTPNGITRMMALYQCNQDPEEIGSIRSAREDFIPLAQGFRAILAHWGGEREALNQLNNGIIDNVDALAYEGTIFYRKKSLPRPHNGFTTLALVRGKADELGYPASASMGSWPHEKGQSGRNIAGLVDRVSVQWPQGMDIEFRYDQSSGTYMRWRGGSAEVDASSGQQVRVNVVVVMNTDATFLRDQYIRVRTTGQGVATIYQNGRRISALWKKAGPTDMLTFTDSQGETIPFVPGKVWIAVDAPLPLVP